MHTKDAKWSPVVWTLGLWIVDTFGFIPLWLHFVDPVIGTWFKPYQALQSINFFLQTDIPQLVYPLLLYVFVVRKYLSIPIVDNLQSRKYRWIAITLIMIMVFLAFVPRTAYNSGHFGIVLQLGFCMLVVGICEEWSYRGVMTRVFKSRIQTFGSILLVSVLFGLSHFAVDLYTVALNAGALTNIVGQAIIGLILGISVWRSGSIWWAAYIHFMFDWHIFIGEPPWIREIHLPIVHEAVSILVVSLVGAEIIRLFTHSRQAAVSQQNSKSVTQ